MQRTDFLAGAANFLARLETMGIVPTERTEARACHECGGNDSGCWCLGEPVIWLVVEWDGPSYDEVIGQTELLLGVG